MAHLRLKHDSDVAKKLQKLEDFLAEEGISITANHKEEVVIHVKDFGYLTHNSIEGDSSIEFPPIFDGGYVVTDRDGNPLPPEDFEE